MLKVAAKIKRSTVSIDCGTFHGLIFYRKCCREMISKLKNAHIFEIRVAQKHHIYIELYSSLLEGTCGIALQYNILLIGGGSILYHL